MKGIIKVIFIAVIINLFFSCKTESVDLEPELPEKENHHPFLIVTKDQFPSLRNKSDQEPWKPPVFRRESLRAN